MSAYGTRFPQFLSNQIMIIWWELDEAMLILIMVFIWFVASSWITFALVIIVPWAFIKAKRRSSRGYLKHLLYRLGLAKLDGYPSAFHRSFLE
jgi:type IV conjugative transfer system protein TraL